MPMTMRGIMQKCPKNRIEASDWVHIKEMKVSKNKEGFPLVKAKTYSTHKISGIKKNQSPVTYVTTIEIYSAAVVVSCSCDDFWSTWEVALNKKGAARLEYSNGRSPDEKNPKLVPGCCKHLYFLGHNLITKGKL